MKLSNLIKQLSNIEKHTGDLEVCIPSIEEDTGLVIHYPCNSITVAEVDAPDTLIVILSNRRCN